MSISCGEPKTKQAVLGYPDKCSMREQSPVKVEQAKGRGRILILVGELVRETLEQR